jgi:hypothetical protein
MGYVFSTSSIRPSLSLVCFIEQVGANASPSRIMSVLSSNGPIRAAQYLRMSSDNQRYSTENQQNAIAEYAQQHGYDIVASYVDQKLYTAEGRVSARLIDGFSALPSQAHTRRRSIRRRRRFGRR